MSPREVCVWWEGQWNFDTYLFTRNTTLLEKSFFNSDLIANRFPSLILSLMLKWKFWPSFLSKSGDHSFSFLRLWYWRYFVRWANSVSHRYVILGLCHLELANEIVPKPSAPAPSARGGVLHTKRRLTSCSRAEWRHWWHSRDVSGGQGLFASTVTLSSSKKLNKSACEKLFNFNWSYELNTYVKT